MAKRLIRINSILGGHNPTLYNGLEGGYSAGIAIDPDEPLADTGASVRSIRTAGVLRPVAYGAFDGAEIDGNVIKIITSPQTSKVYAILVNGDIVSYSSTLGTETLVGTVAGSNAEGAELYNNYIYIFGTGASKNDISRYGPLDGTPTLTDAVWTGATLGSQTGLGNATYPSIRGSGNLPKHWAAAHVDGNLYVLDYDGTTTTAATRGKGLVHKIRTKYGSAAEGDTNDNSAYNVLDLPFGFYPTCIASYGKDIAITAVQTNGTVLEVGKSFLFLWDTTDTNTFYRMVPLPDPIATALLSNNGILSVWGGRLTATGGYSLYNYAGGLQMQEVVSFDEGHPPLPGAVDAFGDRVVWGSFVTYPANAAVIWAYGSKDNRVPRALHCIAKATASATSTDGLVTAIKFAEQASNARPQMVIAWRDASAYGIDKRSTTYQASQWQSELFNIGAPFNVLKVHIPLGIAIAANMTITPTVYTDDSNSSQALTTINNTNFSGKRRVSLPAKITGQNNLLLDLLWGGTALCPVLFPIDILIDVQEQATK